MMNYWTAQNIEFAQQRNYLDELFKVYPLNPNLRREISVAMAADIKRAFNERNNILLVETLLQSELFPLKDSYIPFLRHDREAIKRNPQTVNRITGNLYQVRPLFKNWIQQNVISVPVLNDIDEFISSRQNCILNLSDSIMKDFAQNFLGFTRNKGIDFLAKFNGKYIAGEAKFLTDFGGHQNAQFEDAINTLHSFKRSNNYVIPIAILDGVLYIKGRHKMYEYLMTHKNENILSTLVLREFLYSL